MKKILAILMLVGIIAFPNLAFAQAKIWLTADGASYVDLNSDPWLSQSWVIGSGDFNLDIINTDNKDTIFNTMLVLSIPYNSPDTGWSFTLGGQTFQYSDFSHTGLVPDNDTTPSYVAPHGIFAEEGGARWTEMNVGNIGVAPNNQVTLAFSGTAPTDGAFVHFDAYGHDETGAVKFSNPYSHDVTVTPEPMALVLYGLGGLPIAAHLLRRRKVTA